MYIVVVDVSATAAAFIGMKRTRQVDEPRRGVLPTSTHLWLLTVRHSDTWWTVIPTKAAAVAETSTTTMYIKMNVSTYTAILLSLPKVTPTQSGLKLLELNQQQTRQPELAPNCRCLATMTCHFHWDDADVRLPLDTKSASAALNLAQPHLNITNTQLSLKGIYHAYRVHMAVHMGIGYCVPQVSDVQCTINKPYFIWCKTFVTTDRKADGQLQVIL